MNIILLNARLVLTQWSSYHTRSHSLEINFLGIWFFPSTIGKDNADLEVVTKQVAAFKDVILALHGNPEMSLD